MIVVTQKKKLEVVTQKKIVRIKLLKRKKNVILIVFFSHQKLLRTAPHALFTWNGLTHSNI